MHHNFSSLKLVELVGGGFVINGTKCVTMILESGFGFNEVPASQKNIRTGTEFCQTMKNKLAKQPLHNSLVVWGAGSSGN